MDERKTLVLDEPMLWSGDPAIKEAEHIIIKPGTASLGKGFTECRKLVSIEIPDSVTDLGWGTFMNCTSLVRVKIPKHVKKIGWWLFWGCSSLTEVEIPTGVTEIGSNAFLGCVNLRYIKLPESVKTVNGSAFLYSGCVDQVIYDYPRLVRHYDLYQMKIKDLIARLREKPDDAEFYDLAHSLNGTEWVSLLIEFPRLGYRCPWGKLSPANWARLVTYHPEIAEMCPWEKMVGLYMTPLLKHRPELARWCHWEKLTGPCSVSVMQKLPQFAEKFDWRRLTDAARVNNLLQWDKESILSFFKLKYLSSVAFFSCFWKRRLTDEYFCRMSPFTRRQGLFAGEVNDAATYLIYKSMDPKNAGFFLRYQFENRDWPFLEELCGISPAELIEAPARNKIPFHIALNCPDSLFYPFFEAQAASPRLRDFYGNSVLFPALVHDLRAGTQGRFHFLLKRGYDPDEKNLIGFSCNDVLSFKFPESYLENLY